MINFTVGPVQSSEVVKTVGALDVPYFRTPEFSELMLDNERRIKELAKADKSSRVVFITGSGTASMEAAVMNIFTKNDKVLVINGGSFGQRFVDICNIHEIPCDVLKLNVGQALTSDMLDVYNNKGYAGLLVNIHETSTGVHYDGKLLSDFCKKNNMLYIVDAISSFIADELNVKELGIDVMITGSQKALACPPGISLILMSSKVVEIIQNNNVKSLYFDLKDALKNAERGQTPFTPAVGTLIQINERLKEIDSKGGLEKEQEYIASLAKNFREGIKDLPLDICSESLSNAVTPVATRNCSAYDLFMILKDEYGIWICPNGGALKDKVFRVGHIGNLSMEDNKCLIDALHDLFDRGILK